MVGKGYPYSLPMSDLHLGRSFVGGTRWVCRSWHPLKGPFIWTSKQWTPTFPPESHLGVRLG